MAPGTSLERPSSGDVGPRTRLAVVAVAVGVTGSRDGEGDAASEGSAGGESAGTGKEVDSADVGGHFCGLGDVAREDGVGSKKQRNGAQRGCNRGRLDWPLGMTRNPANAVGAPSVALSCPPTFPAFQHSMHVHPVNLYISMHTLMHPFIPHQPAHQTGICLSLLHPVSSRLGRPSHKPAGGPPQPHPRPDKTK